MATDKNLHKFKYLIRLFAIDNSLSPEQYNCLSYDEKQNIELYISEFIESIKDNNDNYNFISEDAIVIFQK